MAPAPAPFGLFHAVVRIHDQHIRRAGVLPQGPVHGPAVGLRVGGVHGLPVLRLHHVSVGALGVIQGERGDHEGAQGHGRFHRDELELRAHGLHGDGAEGRHQLARQDGLHAGSPVDDELGPLPVDGLEEGQALDVVPMEVGVEEVEDVAVGEPLALQVVPQGHDARSRVEYEPLPALLQHLEAGRVGPEVDLVPGEAGCTPSHAPEGDVHGPSRSCKWTTIHSPCPRFGSPGVHQLIQGRRDAIRSVAGGSPGPGRLLDGSPGISWPSSARTPGSSGRPLPGRGR